MIWKAEKNDIYSVKCAYRLYVEKLVDTLLLRRPDYWSGYKEVEGTTKNQEFHMACVSWLFANKSPNTR